MAGNTKCTCSHSTTFRWSWLLQLPRSGCQQVHATVIGTLHHSTIIIFPVELQHLLLVLSHLLLLLPLRIAGCAKPLPLGHPSTRRLQTVQVTALVTFITQNDIFIVHVQETDPAEARWAVPARVANLLIACDLVLSHALDVVVLVHAKRVATDQEPLVFLFTFSTQPATAKYSIHRQLRKFGGVHGAGNTSSLCLAAPWGRLAEEAAFGGMQEEHAKMCTTRGEIDM